MRGNPEEAFRTVTGRYVWPLDPHVEDIDLVDIACALARMNRFCGHTMLPYSVADHALRVSHLVERLARGEWGAVPHAATCHQRGDGLACGCGSSAAARGPRGIRDLALWGLHHDDAEYLLHDLPTPIKRADAFLGAQYALAEQRLMRVICARFGLGTTEPYLVQIADAIMLRAEQRDLQGVPRLERVACGAYEAIADALPPITARDYQRAEQAYLNRHALLVGGYRD